MAFKYVYASDLADALAKDPALQGQMSQDPVNTVRNLVEIPDTRVYRIVLSFLGSVVLIALIGILVLAFFPDKKIPDAVVAIASTAVGALAGILAPSPTQSKG